MDVDVRLGASTEPAQIRDCAQRAQRLALATVWSSEAAHDPFVLAYAAITETETVRVGTAVAIAHARTPMATALAAWDLQRISGGRFTLGLGTQVRAHVERRYGATWPGAVEPLREYVTALRHIWACWQDGTPPQYEGKYYRFTLTNPEFEPGPLPPAHAPIPVWLAAVGPVMVGLAQEVADGVHLHAFHTPDYLRDVVGPAIDNASTSSEPRPPIARSAPVFAGIVHNERERDALRTHFAHHLAFYASTPAYLPVLRAAGWEHVHRPLRDAAREGRWADLQLHVPAAMVDDFVDLDDARTVGERLATRYAGLLDQVGLYRGGDRFMSEDDWIDLVAAVRTHPK